MPLIFFPKNSSKNVPLSWLVWWLAAIPPGWPKKKSTVKQCEKSNKKNATHGVGPLKLRRLKKQMLHLGGRALRKCVIIFLGWQDTKKCGFKGTQQKQKNEVLTQHSQSRCLTKTQILIQGWILNCSLLLSFFVFDVQTLGSAFVYGEKKHHGVNEKKERTI